MISGRDALIEPPYPADTRAKGWRFDLDYEQIDQSSTWALAGAEVRPWLLMLWFTAWKQTPCASLPADENVIAAMIGMPPKLWAKHSKVLLRGWAKAADGRFYHKVLTKKVLDMLGKRRSETERKAAYRRGTSALSRGTDDGQTADSTRKAAPTPTEKKNTTRARALEAGPLFERFWTAFPRKAGKGAAEKAWAKCRFTESDTERVLSAIRAQSASEQWRKDGGRFIPHPATWLNQRRWEDEGLKLNGAHAAEAPTLTAGQWQ